MMIVDIKKLNAQKKYSGEMQFDYVAPEELISVPFAKYTGAVVVRFSYDLYEDDAFEIRGTISYGLVGQCSRCLNDASVQVEGELQALFEPIKNGEDYSYSNGKVDLTKFNPLCYASEVRDYYTLGERVGKAFSDGLKLK